MHQLHKVSFIHCFCFSFFSDKTSILLELDKTSFKNIAIYYIGYITKKEKYKINSVNPLYLLVHEIDGFIEEKE